MSLIVANLIINFKYETFFSKNFISFKKYQCPNFNVLSHFKIL